MYLSIRSKLLVLCIGLILVTTTAMSFAYYGLIKQDKQRESQQRLGIAFNIMLSDLDERRNRYTERMDDFLKENIPLLIALYAYSGDVSEEGTITFLFDHFPLIAEDFKRFGRIVAIDRLMLYGVNKRLLVSYLRMPEQEILGSYFISDTEGSTYLSMDDLSIQSEVTFRKNNLAIGAKARSFPQTTFPPGIKAEYTDNIPAAIEVRLFQEEGHLGLRIVAPIYRRDEPIGVLVGEVMYTQQMMEEYAALSMAEINLFVENQFAVGTLPTQAVFSSDAWQALPACENMADLEQGIETVAVTIANQEYYQGRCAFKDAGETVGALTVSLSRSVEKNAIRHALTVILSIAGLAIAFVIGLLLFFSRRTITAIHALVDVIDSAAEGNLGKTACVTTHDEIAKLATRLNQMIEQLRRITSQVQTSSGSVGLGADSILQDMESLIQHMEQQSSSVDHTSAAITKINEFIETVAVNTEELFAASDQILASTQESQASLEEVTISTGSLMTNLHNISQSVQQTNQVTGRITDNTGQLETQARHTEKEILHIEQSLHNVSENAGLSQELAQETMEAATNGHHSVEASMQGMNELKAVVADTAQIIREVNSWGEQVSSILGIVDDITGQTALLSLNASIISAQAGVHGRGFAVVAGEIKELANRTKSSTKEIEGLVRELQKKTAEGVRRTEEGLAKADHGVLLAQTAQEALNTILERATRASKRAVDTAAIVQQTAESGGIIRTSMSEMTTMVAHIREALQSEEQNFDQVAIAVENISGMATQLNRSTLEQKNATLQITQSMQDAIIKFSEMTQQTGELQQESRHMVSAINTIETVTDRILEQATDISGETVKNLIDQAEALQKIVNVFK